MARKKPAQPSRTSLYKEAQKCLFDPRADGPMRVIADTGTIDYYEMRAVECIHQAAICETSEAHCEQIRQAVGLLLLSLTKRSQDGQASQSMQERISNPGRSGESPSVG